MFWCENLEFGVDKSVFLVSAENGASVNKMTNITYEQEVGLWACSACGKN